MSTKPTAIAFLVMALIWLPGADASGFYIQSPRTEPCHERLMIGTFGFGEEPFADPQDAAAAELFALFVERVEKTGVPEHEPTRAFIDELADRFDFSEQSDAEQFILASFIAGVREPDTDGMATIKFNETRSVHLQDDNQPKHSLRRVAHDYDDGDRGAITNARDIITERLESAYGSWREDVEPEARARWTFPFYGEAQVKVFVPAFQLGRASHVLQDAYSHTLRDRRLRIVAVSNYAEVVQERYFEPRDGPAHSERLDACDPGESDFDHMRLSEARRQNARLLAEATPAFRDEDADTPLTEPVIDVLDDVYAYRPGCDVDNDYCGSHWLPISRLELTTPFELSLCSTGDLAARRARPLSGLVLLLWGALLGGVLRFRSRRSTA